MCYTKGWGEEVNFPPIRMRNIYSANQGEGDTCFANQGEGDMCSANQGEEYVSTNQG